MEVAGKVGLAVVLVLNCGLFVITCWYLAEFKIVVDQGKEVVAMLDASFRARREPHSLPRGPFGELQEQ